MRTKSFVYAILLVAMVVVVGCGQGSVGGDVASKPYITCAMMFNVVSQGCEAYQKAHGAWPNSLSDLNSLMQDLVHQDAWNHDLAYTPFDSAKGYGEVISYGRDGKPGGTGEDADIVVRFPLKENADWNRQQAMSIKVPPHGNPHWYDFYVSGN